MSKITGDEPAFPNALYAGPDDHAYVDGMTLRQYYTGLAMQGLVSQQAPVDRIINEANQFLTKQIADASVIIADALINSLNKSEK